MNLNLLITFPLGSVIFVSYSISCELRSWVSRKGRRERKSIIWSLFSFSQDIRLKANEKTGLILFMIYIFPCLIMCNEETLPLDHWLISFLPSLI